MPVSKARRTNKKRHPILNEAEKQRAKLDAAVRESYEMMPSDSIAIAVAMQNKAISEHLRSPRGFLEMHSMIVNDPRVRSIEYYGTLLHKASDLTPMQATKLTYTLITYRTLEHWKRIAQSYIVSAAVLDCILSETQPLKCSPRDFALPFRTFFLDLGLIKGSNQREGLFVYQHADMTQIDFVIVNGALTTCITMGEDATVRLPSNPEDWQLNNIDYVSYLLICIVRAMSLDRTLPLRFTDRDDYSHEHNEWRTYITLEDEKVAAMQTPIWNRTEAGVVTYEPRNGRLA